MLMVEITGGGGGVELQDEWKMICRNFITHSRVICRWEGKGTTSMEGGGGGTKNFFFIPERKHRCYVCFSYSSLSTD